MNFLRPMTPATTGPELMPMRNASSRPPNVRASTAACMSRARSTRALAWSGRSRHAGGDHVAVADRLDLLEAVFLDQIVEAMEDLVEQIDQPQRRHRGRHRRESDDIGEQDAGRGILSRRSVRWSALSASEISFGRMLSSSISDRSWKKFRCPTK